MDGRYRAFRGKAAGAVATALLFGITACGGDDSGGSAGGIGDDASPTQSSDGAIISGWENACAVHDVEAIKQFMGIRAFGVEPGSVEPGGGFSDNVVGCDVTDFDMPLWEYTDVLGESVTDDSLAGRMYLRVDYYVTEESFSQAYQNAYDAWAEGSTTVEGRHVVDERTLTGGWEEGSLFVGSDAPDESRGDRTVIGKLREGSWSVSCEIVYDADPVAWGQDQREQVYAFTDEELADWVAETYLPQVHAAVVAALAESS